VHHDHSADWRQHLIPYTPASNDDDGQHPTAEYFFDPLGIRLVQKGWSVFPQNRDERRGPGLVDNRALKWKEFSTRLPTIEEVRWWAAWCPTHNVAAIMGSASGETLALDIDVSDETISLEIQRLANKHLGDTPFRRVGRRPRIVLIYRQAPEAEQAASERIPSRSFRFAAHDADGLPTRSDDGLEILSRGKPVTFYGNHHKTGQYFKWIGKHPAWNGPELAPLITQEQMLTFLAAVQELRPFHRNTQAAQSEGTWTYDPAAGLHIPRAISGDEWVTAEDGIVVDGREAFLFALTGRIVRSNPDAAHGGEAGVEQLRALVAEQFKARAEMSGRWTEDFLRSQIADKVARAICDATNKNSWRRPTAVDHDSNTSFFPTEGAVAVEAEKSADLDWASTAVAKELLRTSKGKGRGPRMTPRPATEESKAKAAMMPREEREEAGKKVSKQVRAAIRKAVSYAYDLKASRLSSDAEGGVQDKDNRMRLHGVMAPTGSGKTVATIDVLDELKTERTDVDHMHVVYLTPTHDNASEVAAYALANEGVDAMDELAERARAKGLTVLHFKGRVTAGCIHGDKMDALYAAHLPGSRLCRTEEVDRLTGEKIVKRCSVYDDCPFRKQIDAIVSKKVHLTLMPHNYHSLPIAKEIDENTDLVVVDESPWRGLVGHMTFPLSILSHARAEPKLYKMERRVGMNPADFITDREEAVRVFNKAQRDGVDPARAFHALTRKTPQGIVHYGLGLLASAARCVSASQAVQAKIQPEMSMEAVQEAINTTTAIGAAEEGVLWRLVTERVEWLIDDEINRSLAQTEIAQGKEPSWDESKAKARGEHDSAIQFLTDADGVVSVRVSYFKRRNFADKPTLLLDASMSRRITETIWNDRDVEIDEIDAPIHLRTILVADCSGADSMFLPSLAKSRLGQAENSARAEAFLHGAARFAGVYANDGMLLGTTKSEREFVEPYWAAPPNVDYLHHGNAKGYDFAKHHSLLYSYGRQMPPTAVIDAYAGIFTRCDPVPERPWDAKGDGSARAPKGKREILMRDGTKRVYDDMVYPEGSWAREIQMQMCEEELRQMVGRLRPVYRVDSEPVWINFSRVVPEGIVVDEIVSMIDIVRPSPQTDHIFEAARRMHGFVAPQVAGFLHPDLKIDPAPLTEREAQGVVNVRWQIKGYEGKWVDRQLLNYVPDLQAAAEALVAEGGHEIAEGTFEVVGERPARKEIKHKAPDKMDRARSAIPWEEQEHILDTEGPMALRAALLEERRANEEALMARAEAGAVRDHGRKPDNPKAVQIAADIPRSQFKGNLMTRALFEAADQDVSTDSLEPETEEAA
jgi:hypothetical protein